MEAILTNNMPRPSDRPVVRLKGKNDITVKSGMKVNLDAKNF